MSGADEPQATPDEAELVYSLAHFVPNQAPLETTLRTNARIITRITDSIHRQPGSALRELVLNGYDANETRLTIRTDRPRFQRIVVEDNGLGMTPSPWCTCCTTLAAAPSAREAEQAMLKRTQKCNVWPQRPTYSEVTLLTTPS